MTSKQILDAFSETLMRDERILSSRERELLTTLLQNAKSASRGNQEIQSAAMATIGRSIGETVAQRAFTLLGSSIVEQIVSRSTTSAGAGEGDRGRAVFAGPQPPAGPQPFEPADEPADRPVTPPSGPQPPAMDLNRWSEVEGQKTSVTASVGVLDAAIGQDQCVVLDEFLAPQELKELIRYTLKHEGDFRNSEVVSPSGGMGVSDYTHRRSRVLMEMGPHEEAILSRIRHVLPRALEQLGMDEFPVTRTEVQITASNEGDFFRAHCDDAQEMIASRRLTFVYFFHQEPRRFTGGELRLYDSRWNDQHPGAGSYEAIVPQQNQIVFFPCSRLHEITPVRCASKAFADSRFTVNGWLHQSATPSGSRGWKD
jgi:Rps23 Pro-64 3,4-dihydroxylase Tpa1-like proline 4-hydroxylase